MNAGRRRDLVTFAARVLTTLPNGGIQTTWSPLSANGGFTEWAEAIPVSTTSARFAIPYREGITDASHQIIWRNSIWKITSVTFDIKNGDLFLNSDFSSAVEVTHIQSTEREFIDGIPTVSRPE